MALLECYYSVTNLVNCIMKRVMGARKSGSYICMPCFFMLIPTIIISTTDYVHTYNLFIQTNTYLVVVQG